MSINSFLDEKDWQFVDSIEISARKGSNVFTNNLNLHKETQTFINKNFPQGLYKHQKKALELFLKGENVCISTGTASGKSLIFYLSALEVLIKNPQKKILAIYPLKALGVEQEKRWINFFNKTTLDIKIGRIDGKVSQSQRKEIIKNNNIIIFTPDVIHAWLMNNLNDKIIVHFLSKISLIIIDEIHNYTGVFGSNSAFLFRRMRHIMKLSDASPKYIVASATISEPEKHLKKLIGTDFSIVNSEWDSSPHHKITIKFVNPPAHKDLLSNIAELMEFIALHTNHNFISFVDSRKQTEHVSSIVARYQNKDQSFEENIHFISNNDHLYKLNILPYRAGYEEMDREIIQERLTQGNLKGIISTSALELGIDIPSLTLCILVGVPHSSTSFYQRIGRIGRHTEGEVIIINTGDIFNENIFKHPKDLLNLPLSEGALYLENQRIQYIHALCLARHGGEHDQITSYLNKNENSDFESPIDWPKGFTELCNSERIGVIPTELQNIKAQAGDDPNHIFPLRDVDVQFQVEYRMGPEKRFLGSLSYGQLMREAYPGAVYYYTTKPYRVYRVKTNTRVVEVRKEKKYTTRPILLPTLVFPNLTKDNIYKSLQFNNLLTIECNLQIREAISGFKERRGPNEITINYPLDPTKGLYFDQQRFTRNYFTTGIILAHPYFNNPKVKCDIIANLFYEAFLMVIPFERRDINFANDKFRISINLISKGDKFICIYDQTYGSLRLSGKVIETEIFKKIWDKLIDLSENNNHLEINDETKNVIKKIYQETPFNESKTLQLFQEEIPLSENFEKFVEIILPGSKGLDIKNDNEEFFVDGVFFSPVINGLAYRGKHLSQQKEKFENTTVIVPANIIVPIPGEAKIGLYNLEDGSIIEKN